MSDAGTPTDQLTLARALVAFGARSKNAGGWPTPEHWALGDDAWHLTVRLARCATKARLGEKKERVWVFGPISAPQEANGSDGTALEALEPWDTTNLAGESRVSGVAVKEAYRLFRMRLAIAQQSAAFVAMGGKPDRWAGRAPGLLEELAFALALGRPVYLIGVKGSQSEALGHLLGLKPGAVGDPPGMGAGFGRGSKHAAIWDELRAGILDQSAHFTAPAPASAVPMDPLELPAFVRQFAVDGRRWPANGLTVKENRELFALDPVVDDPKDRKKRAEAAVALIEKGLHRLAQGR
jgi:SLOG cluster2